MIHLSATTHTSECYTIDFLILLEWITGKFHTYITEHTAVILRIIATMLGARTTFYLLSEHAFIVCSFTADDESAPITRLTTALRLCRSEDDRLCSRAFCIDFTAWFDDERSGRFLFALDDSAWLDGKLGTIAHIYPSFEEVSAFLESLFSFENKFLIAVSYHCAIDIFLTVSAEKEVVTGLDTAFCAPYIGYLRQILTFVIIITAATRCNSHCHHCG